MQPAVEGGADQPSYDEGGGEHEGQLAIAGDLQPWAFFIVGAAIFGWSGGRHSSDSVTSDSILQQSRRSAGLRLGPHSPGGCRYMSILARQLCDCGILCDA